ncbi:hypothetical protein K435DRAFT_694623, partial [Dendrothele bispora CBS 962.96]
SLALLFYDYVLTFPMEVKYIWGARYKHSVILYVCCRYALLANVLYLLAISGRLATRVGFNVRIDGIFPSDLKTKSFSCDTTYKLIGALSVLGRAAVIITFTLRTYVIFARSRIVLVYLMILGAACVALDIMCRIFEYSDVKLILIIIILIAIIFSIANELLSILMVVFEYSSAILTTVRSIQAFRADKSPWKDRKNGLAYLIFEQGILYFSVVSLFTTAAVILNFRAPSGFFQRLLNALTLPLSGILSARFLLHLRKWKAKNSHLTPSGHGSSSIGNVSGTIGTFRAVGGAVASIDDFGEDPVALVQMHKAGLGEGSSATAGGSRSGSDSEKGVHHDSETDQSNPGLEIGTVSESSGGSVEFLGSVKEGKKPIRTV